MWAVQGANGPVQAVLVENWVVYTYWSRAAHRFQATVVELYDDSPHDLTAAQLVFGSHNSTMSSYRPVDLEVPARTLLPSHTASASLPHCICTHHQLTWVARSSAVRLNKAQLMLMQIRLRAS